MYSRRDFGRFALAGVPVAIAYGARANSTVHGVRLGASTYSYRDFPREPGKDAVDALIAALVADGAYETELFAPGLEPAFPRPVNPPGTPPPDRAAMRAMMNGPEAKKRRETLREWRLSTPMSHFEAVGKKFSDAGIKIDAYTMNYRNDFTDEEIDKTIEQAKALGAGVIATSTQMAMAKRLAPFADKYKYVIALHGHSNTKDSEEFSTPETFQQGLDMSKYFKINLDIGHFFAAGFDPVAYIDQHHTQITHLHIKDRKANDGANAPFGEGGTPIKEVLLLLKKKKYSIPALIEYEYRGTGTSTEEVKKCMDYMRQALA